MDVVSKRILSDPIAVAGIKIRASNERELTGAGEIRGVWDRFFGENLLSQIRNRANDRLYVVYSNYENDEYGQYDYLLGAAVTSIDNLPAGMTFEAIPTGEYAIFTSQIGPVAKVVVEAWKEIWSTPQEELGGKRSFITDYEVYGHLAKDPTNAQVEIHLGLMPVAF